MAQNTERSANSGGDCFAPFQRVYESVQMIFEKFLFSLSKLDLQPDNIKYANCATHVFLRQWGVPENTK